MFLLFKSLAANKWTPKGPALRTSGNDTGSLSRQVAPSEDHSRDKSGRTEENPRWSLAPVRHAHLVKSFKATADLFDPQATVRFQSF